VDDLNALLLLRHLVDEGWTDVSSAAPILQLNRVETQGAIMRLSVATINGEEIVSPVTGTPEDAPDAWSISAPARDALQARDTQAGNRRTWPSRERIALSYAQRRGRISTTELGGLVGASPTNVSGVLQKLEQSGDLLPSRENRRGKGFHYLPASGRKNT
jgi:ATP-dependent DNA helicase RecG